LPNRAADTLGFLTQTTLSVDDTADMVSALQTRFPGIQGPRGDDICYATSNRQSAVKAIAQQCDAMLVIGAPNSSNSMRLVEVAQRMGTRACLIQCADEIDLNWLGTPATLGITAGASAPEILVREVVNKLGEHFTIEEHEVATARESIEFKLPRGLELV